MVNWLRSVLVLLAVGVYLVSTAAGAPIRKWSDASGTFSVLAELVEVKEEKVHLKKADGTIIVVPVEKLSEADQKFLADIASGKPATPTPAKKEIPADKPAAPKAPATPAARVPKVGREAIEQALQKPAQYDFADKPLSEALDVLAEQSGIVIFVDRKALTDLGVEPDVPVTARSAGRGDTLAKGLTSILEKPTLVWTISDEVLVVTTKAMLVEDYRYLEARTYLISQAADWDTLASAITTKVAPATWNEVGGLGHIAHFPAGNLAIVLQSPDAHRMLAKEFGQILRPVSQIAQSATAAKTRAKPKASAKAPEGAVVKRALGEPTSCEFVEAPLTDVAAFLAARHKIAIKLDDKALADAGVGTDSPVTIHLPGVKLESALNLMLNQLDLEFILDKDELVITTRDVADMKLVKAVYPVQDLVPAGDFDSLIGTITGVVQPVTWAEVGGTATIEADRDQGTLVVEQTYAGHAELERLFSDIRTALK